MDGKNLFQVFFFFNLIIFPLAQKVGAGAQKSGGAAALPAPPPSRSLLVQSFILKKGFQELLICILVLRSEKKHILKAVKICPSFEKSCKLVDILTNNTQYTTNHAYLHPTHTGEI